MTMLLPILAFLFASLVVAAAAMMFSSRSTATIERRLGEIAAFGHADAKPAEAKPAEAGVADADKPKESGEVKPDPVCVGGASGRDQDIAAFDGLIACWRAHLETDGVSGSALYTENLDPEMHL